MLSYFTDLQGSQTVNDYHSCGYPLSYFTDLQGSQTMALHVACSVRLVTLLIYKVLKPKIIFALTVLA